MTVPEDSLVGALRTRVGGDADGVSLVAVGLVALVAAILVGAGTFAALETGYAAVGLSFLTAVVLFVGALTVFEAGRKVGEEL